MWDLWEIFLLVFYSVLFGTPIVFTVFFGISLRRYLYAKQQNKKSSETFSDLEIKKRKIQMIVLAVIAGVLDTILIGFIGLMFLAIAFM